MENHPVRGASWETFVIEDLIRRERVRNAHSQFYFGRTAAGSEIDLIIERGSKRFGIEIKVGRGVQPRDIQALDTAASDVKAAHLWIVDQADGIEPLRPKIDRRSWFADPGWLPD